LTTRWRIDGSARWPRRDGDAGARTVVGAPGSVPASGPVSCPWPTPWGLLRRSSGGGVTDRRLLLTASTCQARRLRGGRRMGNPTKKVTLWLHPPPGGVARAHRGNGCHGLPRRIHPTRLGSAWPAGVSSAMTAGWTKGNRGSFGSLGRKEDYCILGAPGGRGGNRSLMGRTPRDFEFLRPGF
jgi:hypothetical protein